ncbi:MAG: metallophosphoesterase [Lacrimispora sp.]
MKILVLADHESKSLYEYYTPEKLKDIDLIISCGDLKANYLSFFATFSHAPVFYVRGNHDCQYMECPPEGCTCLEDDIVTYKGVRILGLGGSREYIPGAQNQYTERKMEKRIRHLWWKLKKNKGFDILVTHAPAYELNDLPDLPHQGFSCFRELMDKYSPRLFLHGHVHANYGKGFKREDQYGNTKVVNGYEYYIVDYPE